MRDDETKEQEGLESEKKRIVAGLPVCFLLSMSNETLVSCVTTLEIDMASVDEYTACEHSTLLTEDVLVRPSMSNAQTSDPRGKGANDIG